jgi:hypothetical protein
MDIKIALRIEDKTINIQTDHEGDLRLLVSEFVQAFRVTDDSIQIVGSHHFAFLRFEDDGAASIPTAVKSKRGRRAGR